MDLLGAENDIIAKLAADITSIPVRTYPNTQFDIYKIIQKDGAILVHYNGSTYDDAIPKRSKKVIQNRVIQWAIVLAYRGITGPNIETVRTAAYDYLEAIRASLTGYTVNSMDYSEVLRPVRDSIIAQDKDKGIWFYELIFQHGLNEVEAYK